MQRGRWSAVRLLGLAGLVIVSSGCDEGETADVCAGQSCSGHGMCEDVDGAAVCDCNEGYAGDSCDECDDDYQDNDGDGLCLPTCATAGRACRVHQHCADASGRAECVCDGGYQDNDGNGTCTEDCTTSPLDCGGHGTCDDSGGTVACACDEGYQDHDGDDVCTPDCATADPDCGAHGACDDSSGVPVCACEEGYDRSDCGVCESAYYQDNDGDGVCTPTCYLSAATFSCGENEVCSHATGALACVCARGYQDNDGDGDCLATCATATDDETEPLVCPDPNGVCDDSSGTATCRCRFGYADDPGAAGEDCLACADGYQDHDGDGTCAPDCATSGLDCDLECDDSGGSARCLCPAGEQDNDGDGTCEADCAHAGLVCDAGEHRVCGDASGTAECVCEDGSYDDGMGTCRTIGASDGDTCATEIDLDLTAQTIYADMTGATQGHAFSCDPLGFILLDLVYRVRIAAGETRRLRFTVERVDASGQSFTPAVAVLAGADCGSAAEIACGFGFDPTTWTRSAASADVTLEGGASGTDYHLVVGAYDRRGRVIRAVVRVQTICGGGLAYSPALDECVEDPCAPVGACPEPHRAWCAADLSGAVPAHECRCDMGYFEDVSGDCAANPSAEGEGCTDVTPIDVGGGEGSVSGSTAGAVDDGEGSCGGERPAADRVYGFTLERETRLSLLLDCDDGYDCLLHVRRACDDRDSEILCLDRGGDGEPEETLLTLAPGAWYVFVDGWNGREDETLSDGDYTLEYSFHADPCLDEAAACPGDPQCAASSDWSEFSCVCRGEGEVLHDGACVDDPCAPDPCADLSHTLCVADFDTGGYECACGGVYIDDGSGGCMLKPDAEWTVLWYLAMDNNLYYQTAHEIDDAAAAGLSPDVRVVALVDRLDESRGYYAEFGGGAVDRVAEMHDPDTGDWTTLRDFGVWAVDAYPARHYVLVLADHGGAWKSAGAGAAGTPPIQRAICWDDHSATPEDGIGVANGDLAAALDGIAAAAGRRIDLVVYDACLMSEWEVADASAPYADYMIASPDSSYGFMVRTGAWTDWLDTLVAGADTLTPLQAAEALVDNYRATMEEMPEYVTTMAVTDLAATDELDAAVSGFADALVANQSDAFYEAVDAVRRGAQQTAYNELVDLADFARLVGAMSGAPADVVAAAGELRAQLDRSVVHAWSNVDLEGWTPYYGSVGLAGHNGLTVYLPGRYYQMAPEYTAPGAVWSARATWDDFLATFLTGGYADCAGTAPLMDYAGDAVASTMEIEACCGGRYLVQFFRAPGPELHGIRIAVRKTAGDDGAHQGFFFAVYRSGHGAIWGPAHWMLWPSPEPQYLCLMRMGVPTEPGEELYIVVGGGDPYPGDPSGFQTPIEWPIEYAASAGADPPYAEGEARVIEGDTVNATVGEFNGDGIEGTFWFEVY